MFIRKTRGTTVGTPGASSRTASSAVRKGFSKLSWKARIALSVLGSAVGFISALALGLNPLSGVAVIAAFVLFVSGLFVAPAIWSVVGVLALYLLAVVPYAGTLFTTFSAVNSIVPVAIEAAISLSTAAFLASWLVMRFSRSAPWKSLAWILFGSMIVSFIILAIVPAFGFNAALIAMAAITLYRCGLKDWVLGGFSYLQDKISRKNSEELFFDEVAEDAPLLSRAAAEQETAKVLNSINAGTVVYHDVVAKKSLPIPHVVISTTGVSILNSVTVSGHIYESKQKGLVTPGLDLNDVISSMLSQREKLASALKTRDDSLRLVVVVHSQSVQITDVSRTFAVYSESTGRKTADVHVVSKDQLLSIVDTGLDMWNPLSRRAVLRRASFSLKPAHLQKASLEPKENQSPSTLKVSLLDDDGRELSTPMSQSDFEQTAWMLPGTPVIVETSQGAIGDVVIAGGLSSNSSGVTVVPVCAIEEWESSREENRDPEVSWIAASKLTADSYRA